MGRRTAKKTVKKAVGKRKTSRQVGRRAVSTSARKQGAPPVSSLRLVLEAVDPHRAVAYWEVPPRALTRAREHLGEAQPRAVLRVYEVSGLVFDGTNANESSDVVIDMGRGTHYLSFPSPGKILIAELGFSSQDGRFESLVRSNLVDLPRGAEAPLLEDRRQQVGGVSDPLWRRRWSVSVVSTGTALAAEAALASSDEEEESFDVPRAVRTGGVPPAAASVMSTQAMSPASLSIGTSSDFVSGISSVGFAGEAPVSASGRPARAPSQLDIQADIVIYGHARPETDLVIEGVPVHVRADGTFELRFTLGSVPWRDEPTSS